MILMMKNEKGRLLDKKTLTNNYERSLLRQVCSHFSFTYHVRDGLIGDDSPLI